MKEGVEYGYRMRKMNVSHEIWMMVIYNERKLFYVIKSGVRSTHLKCYIWFSKSNDGSKTIAQTLDLTQGILRLLRRHLEIKIDFNWKKDWKTKHISLAEKGEEVAGWFYPAQHQMMEHTLRGLDCSKSNIAWSTDLIWTHVDRFRWKF